MHRCGLFLFFILSTWPAWGQTWAPYSTLPDLYPSMAIAMPHFVGDPDEDHTHDLGDPNGLLGIALKVPHRNSRVQLKMSCTGDLILFSPATLDVTVPKAHEEYILTPTIPFNQAKLAGIRQVQTAYVTYAVTIDGQAQPPRTEPLRVQSINSCPFGVHDADGSYTSFGFLFAAYVNENYPPLDRILQEALQKRYVDAFDGYQGSATNVYRQVLAIWRVLQDRGIRYSSITTPVVAPEQVASQQVRLLNESLGNTQANCADGSVLLASLLRRIGIEPVLVTVPGHLFIGFDLDEESSQQAYLETTLLNAPASTFTVETDGLADALLDNVTGGGSGPASPDQAVIERFIAAIQRGNRLFAANQAALEAREPDYSIMHVFEARDAGILPIPLGPASGAKR